THATLLLKENVNIKLIQERLGHSRVSTTLDVYSHVLPTMQHIIIDKLDKLVKM
ncbi:MAG: tyrosine-type recombinase/integrase, partial [Bacillota bacterium]|nr:tyrosine-type recombinase/integrase [Bacillota bacterium]